MSQVVEILETIATQSENQEEAMLQSGGSSCVTLYEVPKDTHSNPDKKQKPTNMDGEKGETHQKRKPSNGRSKSEPPNEGGLCSPFVDSESDEKPVSPRS